MTKITARIEKEEGSEFVLAWLGRHDFIGIFYEKYLIELRDAIDSYLSQKEA